MKNRMNKKMDNPIKKIENKIDEWNDMPVDQNIIDWFTVRLSLYSHCRIDKIDSVHINKIFQYICSKTMGSSASVEQDREKFVSKNIYQEDDFGRKMFKTDLFPNLIAKVFGYIREDIHNALCFLGHFAEWPIKEDVNKYVYKDENGIPIPNDLLEQRRLWAKSILRHGSRKKGFLFSWCSESIDPPSLSLELSGVRNWIHCHLPQNADNFDKRIWEPIQKHKQFTEQFVDSQSISIPTNSEFRENIRNLKEIFTFLPFLETAALGAKVTFSSQKEPEKTEDPWGTPAPLRLLAFTLRNADRVMRTRELVKLKIDPSQILSPEKKKCSQQDYEWAMKHLKAGRGLWKWNPPKLPSEK